MDDFDPLHEFEAELDTYDQQHAYTGRRRVPPGPDAASRSRQRSRSTEGNRRRSQSEPAAGRRPRQARRTAVHDYPSFTADEPEQYGLTEEQQQQQDHHSDSLEPTLQQMQELLGDYQADAAESGAEASVSVWKRRSQQEHQHWRQQASAFACALLQQQAEPDAAVQCCSCGCSGAMIRRVIRLSNQCVLTVLSRARYCCAPVAYIMVVHGGSGALRTA